MFDKGSLKTGIHVHGSTIQWASGYMEQLAVLHASSHTSSVLRPGQSTPIIHTTQQIKGELTLVIRLLDDYLMTEWYI